MPDFKIQRFSGDDFGGASATKDITITAVSSLNNAFARLTNTSHIGGGRFGSSANLDTDEIGMTCELINTTTVRLTRDPAKTNNQSYSLEVIEYSGVASGPNEFIVRQRGLISNTTGAVSVSVAISGFTDRNKCVPFLTGQRGNLDSGTTTNPHFTHSRLEWDSSNNLISRISAAAGTINYFCSYAVVEFTGSNWLIGHGNLDSISSTSQDVTIVQEVVTNQASPTTQDIGDWNKAFVEQSFRPGGSGGVSVNSSQAVIVKPKTADTTGVTITRATTVNTPTMGVCFHVLKNADFSVQHQEPSDPGTTDGTFDVTLTTTLADLARATIHGSQFTQDTGNSTSIKHAHNLRIKDVNTIEWKNHKDTGSTLVLYQSVVTWPVGEVANITGIGQIAVSGASSVAVTVQAIGVGQIAVSGASSVDTTHQALGQGIIAFSGASIVDVSHTGIGQIVVTGNSPIELDTFVNESLSVSTSLVALFADTIDEALTLHSAIIAQKIGAVTNAESVTIAQTQIATVVIRLMSGFSIASSLTSDDVLRIVEGLTMQSSASTIGSILHKTVTELLGMDDAIKAIAVALVQEGLTIETMETALRKFLGNIAEQMQIAEVTTTPASIFKVLVAESLRNTDLLDAAIKLILSEGITIAQTGTAFRSALQAIYEQINLSAQLQSSASLSEAIEEAIEQADAVSAIMQLVLAESMTLADVVAGYETILETIREVLNLHGVLASTGTFHTALASAIVINDVVKLIEMILEGFGVEDQVTTLLSAFKTVVEDLGLASGVTTGLSVFAAASDSIEIEDALTAQGIYNAFVNENLALSVLVNLDGVVYEGWVMNPTNAAVWRYTNYNFNSIAVVGDEVYMANEDGLYKMEGVKDDGEYIVAKIKTASLDFGSSALKSIEEICLGVVNTGELVLKVTVDGQHTTYYELKNKSTGLENQRIRVGKGLHGRYWQFELITRNNTELELDSFEILPFVFGRRVR